MLTWQQLRNLKLSALTSEADGWGKVSNRAHAALTRAESEMSVTLKKSQESEATTAATSRINRLERNFEYIHIECSLTRTLLNNVAEELAAPQRKLKNALGDAAQLKFTVHDDGSVTYPRDQVPLAPGTDTARAGDTAPPGRLPLQRGPDPDPNKAKAQAIAEDIAAAVREANEIDARYTRALAKLKAEPGLDVTARTMADAAHDGNAVRKAVGRTVDKSKIPHGKSPAANKEWWDSLSPDERSDYLALYPAQVGALDGIPSTARDDANRMVLAETHGLVKTQLNALGPEPAKYFHSGGQLHITPAWATWNEKAAPLLKQLKGTEAVQARFDQSGQHGLPNAYLLGFDTRGNGHAVIANGNPDTARNTAVYVPGTGQKLENIEGGIKRMTDLWSDSKSITPSVSTITWLGYDAPQNIVTDSPMKHYAYDGAPKLNQFLEGIQTAQGGDGSSHTTVIGHSYGTTTVGAAAQKGDLAADDVIAVGSPGMLVGSAGELDVGKNHVWSEAASDDAVPALGSQVGLGGHSFHVQRWHGIPYQVGFHGSVPSAESFGAHRMDVDTHGHSGYWNNDSMSLANQAAVVTGHYDRVQES